jgi:hypothetical protein
MGLRLAGLRERIERPITAFSFSKPLPTRWGAAIAGGIFGEHFGPAHVLAFSIFF